MITTSNLELGDPTPQFEHYKVPYESNLTLTLTLTPNPNLQWICEDLRKLGGFKANLQWVWVKPTANLT